MRSLTRAELTQRVQALQAELQELRAVHEIDEARIEAQDKRIGELRQLIDEYKRELYSVENELDNLRGY